MFPSLVPALLDNHPNPSLGLIDLGEFLPLVISSYPWSITRLTTNLLICLDRIIHTRLPRRRGTSLPTVPAVLLAALQILMRTGPRYQISLSGGGSRTALPRGITVGAPLSYNVLCQKLISEPGMKLKRRLEDLERRAGSSSASQPQMHAEVQQTEQAAPHHIQQCKRSPEVTHQQVSPRVLPSQYTPPMQNDDDLMFSHGFERDGSRTPLFAYQTYPAPEDLVYPQYPHSQPYRTVSSSGDRDSYAEYLAPAPVTLPSMMQFHNSIKRETATL